MNMLETLFHETRECKYYLHRRAALYTTKLFYSSNDSYIKYANFITSNELDTCTTCNHISSTDYEHHGLSAKHEETTQMNNPDGQEANIWTTDDLICR